jgi:ParB family chromosome partitioning protein
MAVATIPRGTAEILQRGAMLELRSIPMRLIAVGPNVRADVGDLEELAASIAHTGVLQPIRVTPLGDGTYKLIFGQRRLAASKLAGLTEIPAMVSLVDVGRAHTFTQLVENLQRRDLGPIEEAKAFQQLLAGDKELTQTELARRIGRSAPYVSNALRILELDPKVLPLVASGQLSGSHAKALASLKGKAQRDMADEVIGRGLSAHQTEEWVERHHAAQKREADEVAELATWAETAEKVLIEKGADKKTTVLTSVDGYGYYDEKPRKALKARGWKSGGNASYSRAKCDCDAFGVGRTYNNGVQAVRRCIVQAHYTAKQLAEGKKGNVSYEEQNRIYAARRAQADAVRAAVRPILARTLKQAPEDLVRILLWTAFGWQVNDWVKDHKGDRKKPDAWGSLTDLKQRELVDEAATRILAKFDDHSGVRLDWPAIAEAFGVTLPAEKPAPAKKAAKP